MCHDFEHIRIKLFFELVDSSTWKWLKSPCGRSRALISTDLCRINTWLTPKGNRFNHEAICPEISPNFNTQFNRNLSVNQIIPRAETFHGSIQPTDSSTWKWLNSLCGWSHDQISVQLYRVNTWLGPKGQGLHPKAVCLEIINTFEPSPPFYYSTNEWWQFNVEVAQLLLWAVSCCNFCGFVASKRLPHPQREQNSLYPPLLRDIHKFEPLPHFSFKSIQERSLSSDESFLPPISTQTINLLVVLILFLYSMFKHFQFSVKPTSKHFLFHQPFFRGRGGGGKNNCLIVRKKRLINFFVKRKRIAILSSIQHSVSGKNHCNKLSPTSKVHVIVFSFVSV